MGSWFYSLSVIDLSHESRTFGNGNGNGNGTIQPGLDRTVGGRCRF